MQVAFLARLVDPVSALGSRLDCRRSCRSGILKLAYPRRWSREISDRIFQFGGTAIRCVLLVSNEPSILAPGAELCKDQVLDGDNVIRPDEAIVGFFDPQFDLPFQHRFEFLRVVDAEGLLQLIDPLPGSPGPGKERRKRSPERPGATSRRRSDSPSPMICPRHGSTLASTAASSWLRIAWEKKEAVVRRLLEDGTNVGEKFVFLVVREGKVVGK